MPRVAPGEPMPKTTDKMLAAFDAKGVMVSITLRYTRPGLSAPTYLVRPWLVMPGPLDCVQVLALFFCICVCASDSSFKARRGRKACLQGATTYTAYDRIEKAACAGTSTRCRSDALFAVLTDELLLALA